MSEVTATQEILTEEAIHPLFDALPDDWRALLGDDELRQFTALGDRVDHKYATETVYPPKEKVFRAFELCPVKAVKCVIMGQDPYFTRDQANGLAFSCETYGVLQPSLRNILKEVQRDFSTDIRTREVEKGNLEGWADQGVLLLNTILTVKEGEAKSHSDVGWKEFTHRVIYKLLQQRAGLVMMRWGRDAQAIPLPPSAKCHNLILDASHPSPLSYAVSFRECGHFAAANRYLEERIPRKEPIRWI